MAVGRRLAKKELCSMPPLRHVATFRLQPRLGIVCCWETESSPYKRAHGSFGILRSWWSATASKSNRKPHCSEIWNYSRHPVCA
jgi:hypothetical protein